jgi:hypothetical protein
MARTAQVAGTLVFGGVLIGIWLYFVLFEEDAGAAWTWWGVAGLVLGTSAFATRVHDQTVRIGIWVAVGLVAGVAGTAAFMEEDASIFAGLLTGVGAATIARAVDEVLPGRRGDEPKDGAPPAGARSE